MVELLELSQLNQQELLTEDIDLDKFKAVIAGVIEFEMVEAIIAADVSRTIDGASTLNVSIEDYDRFLLRSGRLSQKIDVKIDGLWWRLAKVEKQGDVQTLVFEDREIGVLRRYTKLIMPSQATSRSAITRAEFILSMLNEVKEFKIPYYIPELHTAQPVEVPKSQSILPSSLQSATNNIARGKGINPKEQLTVKKAPASIQQLTVGDTALKTADKDIPDSNPYKRKLMVCLIMALIDENSIQHYPYTSDNAPAGPLQQFRASGWPGTDDVATDVTGFLLGTRNGNTGLLDAQAKYPNVPYGDLVESVQHSTYTGPPPYPRTPYEEFKDEAENWVNAFGLPGGDTEDPARDSNDQLPSLEGTDYHFYRGKPPTTGQPKWLPESTWECIKRLAQEVNWRAFFVSGVFYYMSEDYLFKSRPRAILSEDDDGVNSIDGDMDGNKKIGTAVIDCHMGRFDAVPGTIIKLYNMGPWNGRWIVTTVNRDLFDTQGTIELKKPDPKFSTLEPQSNAFGGVLGSDKTTTKRKPPPTPTNQDMRAKLVETAKWFIANANTKYSEYGDRGLAVVHTPLTKTYFTTDCSGAVVLIYGWSGAPSPDGLNYNAIGYTGSFLTHCTPIDQATAQPGDIVVWTPPVDGHHACMLLETGDNPLMFSFGSNPPHTIRLNDETSYQCSHYGACDAHFLNALDK